MSENERLLTKEQTDACDPSTEQIDSYEATPDDKMASFYRENDPEYFHKASRLFLFVENVKKSQDAKTLRAVGEWLKKHLHSGSHGEYGTKGWHEDYLGLKESEIDSLLRGEFPKDGG